MTRLGKMILPFACVLLLASCTTQRYVLQEKKIASFANYESGQTFFFQGIGQTQHIDAAQVCGGKNKVAAVEFHQSVLDILLTILSNGIYTPRTVGVYCAR